MANNKAREEVTVSGAIFFFTKRHRIRRKIAHKIKNRQYKRDRYKYLNSTNIENELK